MDKRPAARYLLSGIALFVAGTFTLFATLPAHLPAARAAAETTTLVLQQGLEGYSGARDTTLKESSPGTPACCEPELIAGWISYVNPPHPNFEFLLSFDLWQLPDSAAVAEATLRLYITNRSQAQPVTLRGYRVLRHWSDTTGTWQSRYQGQAWAGPGAGSPGIDRAADPFYEMPLDQAAGWITIPLASLVQAWVAEPAANMGMLIQIEHNDWETVDYRFASSDNFIQAWRPQLVVTYTAQPGQLAVLQQGLAGYERAADATIDYWHPTTAQGSQPYLSLDWRDTLVDVEHDQNALLRFNLEAIPAQAVVRQARLFVFMPPVNQPDTVALRAWRLLRYWSENEVTWVRPMAGDTWAIPGANGLNVDRLAQPDLLTTFTQPDGWLALDVTTLAQFFVAHPEANRGLLLDINSLNGNTAHYDIISQNHFQANWRPLLRIDYTTDPAVPTPTPTATPAATIWQQAILRQGLYGYSGTSDTTLNRWRPTTNLGTFSLLTAGWRDDVNDPPEDQRVLMRFGLESIPASAVISQAQLSLYVPYSTNPHPARLTVARLLRPWWENQATWTQAATGSPWFEPGANGIDGDRMAGVEAAATLNQPNGWVNLDVSGLVQLFVSEPSSNYGLLLLLQGLDGQTAYYDIFSANYWQTERRPTLRITYSIDPAVATPTATPSRTPTPPPTETPTPGTWRTLVLQQGQDGYAGTFDADITSYAPDTNAGNSPYLDIRWSNDIWPPRADMKSVIYFDLGSLPAGAVVRRATLEIYQTGRSNATPLALSVYRVLRAWTESEVTWNRAMAGPGGDLLWNVPGIAGAETDRTREPVAQATLTQNSGWLALDVSDSVQLWSAQPYWQRGLLLQGQTATGDTVLYSFASRDYARDTALRPRLTIEYSVDASVATSTPTATPTVTPLPTATPSATATPTPISDPDALTLVLQQGSRGYFDTRDTWIGAFQPNAPHGDDDFTQVGSITADNAASLLISFSLQGLPDNALILGAWLELYQRDRTQASPLTVSAYALRRAWSESRASWRRASVSTEWQQPGATGDQDRDPLALDALTLDADNGWARWDVTSAVKQWQRNPENNYGLLLSGSGAQRVLYQFDSAERIWGGGNPIAGRPRLIIVYRLP